MKINKIFILSLLLLAILTVGFVSAVEDNITAEEDLNLESDEVEQIVSDNLLTDEADEGTYIDPTEAYQYLNEFRTSKGVWFWDSDNENIIYYNTNKNNQLQPLEIDEGLAEVAKIRVKEIVINFEHERPDGSIIQPLYENYTGYSYFGENLAFSYFTGWDVTEAWKESLLPYEHQGHRRTMLDPALNCVGIAGYIEPGGCPFWVQAFGYNGISSQQPKANITYDESKGSFADLYNEILKGNSVLLDKDYEYKNESAYTNGIVIDKTITIDGCDHSIDAKKLTRIFNITAQNVVLKNINFMNAYVDYVNGGAIFTNGDLTLINCNFSDCFAYYGSAVYSTASSLSLSECSFNDNFEVRGTVFKDTGNVSVENSNFINNSAILYGGALFINDAYMTIVDSVFENNSAYLRGGAIFSARSRLSITSSSFISNALDVGGSAYGAVLCAEDSDILFKDCSFSKNRMNSHIRQAFGGVMYLFDGNVSVISCNFTDNFAMDYGGALCLINNNASIVGCNFIGNAVYKGSYDSSGGAIYATAGNISISQAIFSDNTAENGASIALDVTEVSINDSSFLNNSAGSNGASVYSNNANLTIADCEFFNNTCRFNGGAVYLRDGKISVMNSVFSKSVAAYGAFLRLENAQISIVNDNFTEGVTKNQYYSYGGAMYINNCHGFVEQSGFSKNAVYSDEFTTMGGAVRCENSDVSFKYCGFSDNLADNGAAISSQNANISISNSNFKNNTAKNNGGALESETCNISISSTEFKDCYSFDGGAVSSYGGSLNVAESRFLNNSAYWGGAIYSVNSQATAYDSNFTGNVAECNGGALYGCNAVNSIFEQNKADAASAMYGDNNNATACTFIRNVAYSENPTSGVTTKDCTFKDNKLIVKVVLDVSQVVDSYYPGNTLSVYIYDVYTYQYITNATVTIRIYDANGFVKSSDFSSGNYGWTVNLTEGSYHAVLSIDDDGFESDPVNVTFNVLKKEIVTLNVTLKDTNYSDPMSVGLRSNVDGNVDIRLDDNIFDYQYISANTNMQLNYSNIPSGKHVFSFTMMPINTTIDSITVYKEFTVYGKPTSISLEVKDTTSSDDVVVYVLTSEDGWVSVQVDHINQSVYVQANQKTEIVLGVLNKGEYNVTARLVPADNYEQSEDSKTLKICEKISGDDISVSMPEGDSNKILINLPHDATGSVTLSIGGKDYEIGIVDGVCEIVLPELNGEYEYRITYAGDENYSGFDISGNLNTNKNMLINPNMQILPEDMRISVKLPNDATGTVTLAIDGETIIIDVSGEITIVNLPDLANGNYTYSISYSGDGKYSSVTTNGTLNVNNTKTNTTVNDTKISPELKVIAANVNVGEAVIVDVSINKNVTGNVIVTFGGIESVLSISDGKGTYSIPDLAVGEYDVLVRYVGDEYFTSDAMNVTFKVVEAANQGNGTNTSAGNGTDNNGTDENKTHDNVTVEPEIAIPSLDEPSDNGTVTITLPSDATGTVTLDVNGKKYAFEVKDGVAVVKLPELDDGDYDYTITYSGDSKYQSTTKNGSMNVKNNKTNAEDTNITVEPEITIPSLDEPAADGSVTITLPSDATGTVTLSINGKVYSTVDVKNGQAKVVIPELANGNYQYTITYSGDSKYSPITNEGSMKVNKTTDNPSDNKTNTTVFGPVISASDLTALYSSNAVFKVTVNGTDGKLAKNTPVVFKVNGVVFANVNTDANGIATFTVTQVPGKYTVTAEALGSNATAALTVKHVVKLKKVSVKRSAKKLVLTATLKKVNGKYIVKKKVTFKFNGKKYTAKTNKKGVAKYTIKSKVLKKLKAGKKVTYQATYGKDTVKKTVKVKK